MFEALIISLIVYALYAFIYWVFRKRTFKENVSPHKRIVRYLWIYCVFLIGIAIMMIAIPQTFNEFRRPSYGNYAGLYFPYGRYSDLRIGNIHEESHFNENTRKTEYKAHFLRNDWVELDAPDSCELYRNHLRSLITYDSDQDSETFGRGVVLHVFDLSEDIIQNEGNEDLAYEKLIRIQVNDSSIMQKTENFIPYKSIATPTLMHVTPGDENPCYFEKFITIFANSRAYVFIFIADQHTNKVEGVNTFDLLDNEFKDAISKLDLHSYSEWQKAESKYNHYLSIQSWLYVGLYVLCIGGAIICAFRYLRNIGTVNIKAGKVCKILSIINIVVFLILGVSFIAAFGTIQHEYIHEMYHYQFESYINSEYAATSVLCYGAYFILLIIPTNIAYVKSYTIPKIIDNQTTQRRAFLYWIVRPFALIAKWSKKITKSVRNEYHKQISDMEK